MNGRRVACAVGLSLTLVVGAATSCSSSATSEPVVPVATSSIGLSSFVDPFIGTGKAVTSDPVPNGLTGATFPAAAAPFGMVQIGPDTESLDPPGYHHGDGAITGFSLTHLNGAGCAGLRDFPFFPSASRPDFGATWRAPFSHRNEHASPGFYEVTLDGGIVVDVTATQRAGLAQFTFPEGSDAHVVLAGGYRSDVVVTAITGFEAHVANADTVTGSRDGGRFCFTDSKYRLYYALRFDRPFATFGTVDGGEPTDGARDVSSARGGVFLRFPTSPSRVVRMKVGLSYVSVEHALANLDAEIPTWDFDAVHRATEDAWNRRLGAVRVEGGDDSAKRSLYTALYHVLVQPAVFSDVDGSYVGFDGKVKVDAAHPRYANFSGWDVYRSWVHLAAALAPRETSDFMRSLVEAGKECGALPRWSLANDDTGSMIGDPAVPALAGAYAFGARDFDAPAALALAVQSATNPTTKCNASIARPCLDDYLARGFCPGVERSTPSDGHVSVTQEYAVADYAIAQLADALGDQATRATFVARSGNWKNVFDVDAPGGPLPQPRNRDDVLGKPSFIKVPPEGNAGFTEGNPAQYTFFVPHDPYGLIALLGGDQSAVARLDDLFVELNAGISRPHFYMGNEPQFATPWLYAFAGAPYKTQGVVRRILRETYAATPGGLPGNDDLGATSAWQVWAMLGLYPAVTASGTLVIGSPWFDKTTVTWGSGKTLVITTKGASADAPYVQSLRLSGQEITRSWLRWDELATDVTLDFALGPTPNVAFGAAPADRPPVK